MASITREECQRTHDEVNSTLKEIREDVKTIKDNHLVHINDKMDSIQKENNEKFNAMQKALIIVFFLSFLAMGIRIGEIAGLIP